MAALRTGLELITSANLPQGRRSGGKRGFRLKAKQLERRGAFFMHGTFLMEEKERDGEVILEVFDEWAPTIRLSAATHTQATRSPPTPSF